MERQDFVRSTQCESCPTPRTARAQQTEFGGVEIISASAAGGTVSLSVEVGAVPIGSATGELRVVAEQAGTEIGSVTERIQQIENRVRYEVSFPVTPRDGFESAGALVTVQLREDGQTVDTVDTQVSLSPGRDPGDGAPECVELTVVGDGSDGGEGPPDGGEGGLSRTALLVGGLGLAGLVAARRRGG